jgi:hypothetical protein
MAKKRYNNPGYESTRWAVECLVPISVAPVVGCVRVVGRVMSVVSTRVSHHPLFVFRNFSCFLCSYRHCRSHSRRSRTLHTTLLAYILQLYHTHMDALPPTWFPLSFLLLLFPVLTAFIDVCIDRVQVDFGSALSLPSVTVLQLASVTRTFFTTTASDSKRTRAIITVYCSHSLISVYLILADIINVKP